MTAVKGRGRPELGDVDLSDLPGPALPGADPVELARRRAFASSLETSDFLARSTDSGMVKVMRQPPAAPARKLRSEEPNFTVRLPDYVQQAVRMEAVRQKTTVRLLLLRALRQAGFEVQEEDMTDDRGIVSKLRGRERRG